MMAYLAAQLPTRLSRQVPVQANVTTLNESSPLLTADEERELLATPASTADKGKKLLASQIPTPFTEEEQFLLAMGDDGYVANRFGRTALIEPPPAYTPAIVLPKPQAAHATPALLRLTGTSQQQAALALASRVGELDIDQAQLKVEGNILGIHPGLMKPLLAATVTSTLVGSVAVGGFFVPLLVQKLTGNPLCHDIPWHLLVPIASGSVVGAGTGSLMRNNFRDRDVDSIAVARKSAGYTGATVTVITGFGAWIVHLIAETQTDNRGNFLKPAVCQAADALSMPGLSAITVAAAVAVPVAIAAAPVIIVVGGVQLTKAAYQKSLQFFGTQQADPSPV